jgi:hypothetical protein
MKDYDIPLQEDDKYESKLSKQFKGADWSAKIFAVLGIIILTPLVMAYFLFAYLILKPMNYLLGLRKK